jgi:hypothetical protein
MPTVLRSPDGNLDRAALMRDAHKRYAERRRLNLGRSFSQCLVTALAAAEMQRQEKIMESIRFRIEKAAARQNRTS